MLTGKVLFDGKTPTQVMKQHAILGPQFPQAWPEGVPELKLAATEDGLTVKTPDGACDAAFIHPSSGSHPAVIIWPDAFGLRPAMRDIGKRIAAEGYSVLVPNPFYRVAKAPVFDDPSAFNFSNPTDMAKLRPLMASVNGPGAAEKDAVAYIAFLDAQSQVAKNKKIGTQGYCMGGPLVVKTAAAVPNRVGAGASPHTHYQDPVFGMLAHGSAFGSAAPFCSNSTEMLSGERTKAMRPSRGGRLMVTPPSISR